MTEHPGTLTGICPSAIVLTNHSLAKSEQKISEVLKELNASQTRERAVSEARKVDKAAFEEATKRLESRVSSLEAELDRSRESYVIWFIFRFYLLITS
jgi:exonuclease VII small subunit